MQTIMKKTSWRVAVIITAIVSCVVRTQAQEFSKNSIKVGAGVEGVDNTKVE